MGRGCILTPPTTQFQCDVGATPTPGFAVGCDGTITENGNSAFWICPTGDNGGYNICKCMLSVTVCAMLTTFFNQTKLLQLAKEAASKSL